MDPTLRELPFIDEHQVVVAASRAAVWATLRRYVDTTLGFGARNPVARLLGTRPHRGFAVAGEIPLRELTMAGRHRFSRYALVFQLADAADGHALLKARSYAVFPGPHGRVYRALVIGSGAHVVATRGILRSIRNQCLESPTPDV